MTMMLGGTREVHLKSLNSLLQRSKEFRYDESEISTNYCKGLIVEKELTIKCVEDDSTILEFPFKKDDEPNLFSNLSKYNLKKDNDIDNKLYKNCKVYSIDGEQIKIETAEWISNFKLIIDNVKEDLLIKPNQTLDVQLEKLVICQPLGEGEYGLKRKISNLNNGGTETESNKKLKQQQSISSPDSNMKIDDSDEEDELQLQLQEEDEEQRRNHLVRLEIILPISYVGGNIEIDSKTTTTEKIVRFNGGSKSNKYEYFANLITKNTNGEKNGQQQDTTVYRLQQLSSGYRVSLVYDLVRPSNSNVFGESKELIIKDIINETNRVLTDSGDGNPVVYINNITNDDKSTIGSLLSTISKSKEYDIIAFSGMLEIKEYYYDQHGNFKNTPDESTKCITSLSDLSESIKTINHKDSKIIMSITSNETIIFPLESLYKIEPFHTKTKKCEDVGGHFKFIYKKQPVFILFKKSNIKTVISNWFKNCQLLSLELEFIDSSNNSSSDTLENSIKLINYIDSINSISPMVELVINQYLPNHKDAIIKHQHDKLLSDPIKFIQSLSTIIQLYSVDEITKSILQLNSNDTPVDEFITIIYILVPLNKQYPTKITLSIIETTIQKFENKLLASHPPPTATAATSDSNNNVSSSQSSSQSQSPSQSSNSIILKANSYDWINYGHLKSWKLLNEYSFTFLESIQDQIRERIKYSIEIGEFNKKNYELLLRVLENTIPKGFRQEIRDLKLSYFNYLNTMCIGLENDGGNDNYRNSQHSILFLWGNLLELVDMDSSYDLQLKLSNNLICNFKTIIDFQFIEMLTLKYLQQVNFNLDALINCWKHVVSIELARYEGYKVLTYTIKQSVFEKAFYSPFKELYEFFNSPVKTELNLKVIMHDRRLLSQPDKLAAIPGIDYTISERTTKVYIKKKQLHPEPNQILASDYNIYIDRLEKLLTTFTPLSPNFDPSLILKLENMLTKKVEEFD